MALNNSDPSNREAEMAAGSVWTASPVDSQRGGQQAASSESGRDDASDSNSAGASWPREAHGADGNPLPASSEGPGSGFGSGNSGPTSVPAGNGESDSGSGGTQSGSSDSHGTTPVASGGDNPPATGSGGTAGESGGSILDNLPGVGSIISGTGMAGGITDTTGGVIAGVSNLVNDVANLPGMILNGDIGGGVSQVVSDVTGIAGSALDAVTGALDGNDALAPVTGLVGDVTGGLQNLPLVNLDGGDTAGASLLDLGGSSSGNAVDVAGGPSTDHGIGLGVLADPGTGSTAGIHALDVGPDGPQIVDANLLTGDDNGINLPHLNGIGVPDIAGATANPLLTVNGGNTGDGTGLTLGDLSGSSDGHFVNADAGPANDNGTALGVLSSPSAADHTADVSVLDVGSDGPQLLDAGLLNDAGIPALNGSGVGDLADTGNLLDAGNLLDTGNLLNAGDMLDTSGNLVSLNGGNNADNGGIAGAGLVNLEGSSSGHLVDADAGPNDSGSSVDVLTAPSGADHTAVVNLVDVGSDGPQLADLGLLNDPGLINVPGLNGTGTDGLTGLTGNLLSGATDQGMPAATTGPLLADLGDTLDLVPLATTGDHGIVDVTGHHVI